MNKFRIEHLVFMVAIIVIAYLFALNGRYQIVSNDRGLVIFDRWTATSYVSTGGIYKLSDFAK